VILNEQAKAEANNKTITWPK